MTSAAPPEWAVGDPDDVPPRPVATEDHRDLDHGLDDDGDGDGDGGGVLVRFSAEWWTRGAERGPADGSRR